MEPTREAMWWRSIRWAAYACLALALLQALALPWPFGHPNAGSPAMARWLGQIAFALLGAVALYYRQLWAAGLLGLYALTRIYVIVASLIHVLDGSAVAAGLGPGVYVALLIPLPFAVLWVRGGWAALQLWRRRSRTLERAI